jgi:cysteine desulfurase
MLYLDHNATSPLRPQAFEAMLPHLRPGTANPSSAHRAGQAARAALEQARDAVAEIAGGWPEEWIFTSGATESCNLALWGLCAGARRPLLYGATEHPAVTATAAALGRSGTPLEVLPVRADGTLDLAVLDAALLRHPGAVVALMLANNETGVLHPVAEAAARVHARGGLLFCDLSQALGKLEVDVRALDVDAAAASACKFGGPQGSGLLWLRKGLRLEPLLHGGHQEGGLRPGTTAVAQAVGCAAALKAAGSGLKANQAAWAQAVSRLEGGLKKLWPGTRIHGAGAPRVANTLCVSLPGLESELLLIRLDQAGLRVSAGAACASGAQEPSPVLKAMGVDEAGLKSELRFSFGPGQGEAEAEQALELLRAAVKGFG